jgi:hypothetical protein
VFGKLGKKGTENPPRGRIHSQNLHEQPSYTLILLMRFHDMFGLSVIFHKLIPPEPTLMDYDLLNTSVVQSGETLVNRGLAYVETLV